MTAGLFGFGNLNVEQVFDYSVALENGVIDKLTVHFFGVDFIAGVPVITEIERSQEHNFFAVIGLVRKFSHGTGFFRNGFRSSSFGIFTGGLCGCFIVGAGLRTGCGGKKHHRCKDQ